MDYVVSAYTVAGTVYFLLFICVCWLDYNNNIGASYATPSE